LKRRIEVLLAKKFQLTKEELKKLRKETEGYAWIAVDVKKHLMVVGDEHYSVLKKKLFEQKSRSRDVWGVGLDMRSGEIDYCSPINRKLLTKRPSPYVPTELIDRVNTEIQYFFDNLRAVRNQRI